MLISNWIKDSRELVEEISVVAGFQELGEEGDEDCARGESEIVGNSLSYIVFFQIVYLFLQRFHLCPVIL